MWSGSPEPLGAKRRAVTAGLEGRSFAAKAQRCALSGSGDPLHMDAGNIDIFYRVSDLNERRPIARDH
jgi:hypothetical protein